LAALGGHLRVTDTRLTHSNPERIGRCSPCGCQP